MKKLEFSEIKEDFLNKWFSHGIAWWRASYALTYPCWSINYYLAKMISNEKR